MKPIAADTDKGMFNTHKATKPPTKAIGTLIKINPAVLIDPNALKSNTKINNNEIGTTSDKRFIARSWFSNSPDQLMA